MLNYKISEQPKGLEANGPFFTFKKVLTTT